MKRSESRAAVGNGIDPWLLIALLLGALFLFANLGDRALWIDEAESALLARNIQRFGLPRAFDGLHYVSQSIVAGRPDFDENGIWVLSPWLQLYVMAGSFAAFGQTPFAARLPFAAAGLACIWAVYRLAFVAFADRRIARLAALLLVFCVPFLLHARQGRYYPLVALFTLSATAAHLRLLAGRPRAAPWLVLSLALLFHANYGVCAPVVAGLALHGILFGRARIGAGTAAGVLAGVAALTAPWALYARIDQSSSLIDPSHVAFNLLNYAITLNHYVLPLVWLPVFWLLRSAARRGSESSAAPSNPLAAPVTSVVACVTATSLLFAGINANYFFRYAIHLVPLLVMLHAALLVAIGDLLSARFGERIGRAATAAAVALAIVSTLPALPVFPLLYALEARATREPWADDPLLRRPRAELFSPVSDLFGFLHEITHHVRGPDAAIAEFLAERARPDDLVFADYGDLPILFATGLTVRGGSQGVPYLGEPDWIVSRAFESPERLQRFAREHGYAEHVLDVADTRWENQPDPYAHRFRTVPYAGGSTGQRPIRVYERPRDGASPDTLTVGMPRGPLPPVRHAVEPNVLLVTVDSLRADRVTDAAAHFTGPTRLSRLAAASASFTRARSAAPGTAAAAASVLTGLAPRELGWPGPLRDCPAGTQTLADRLRAAGYETAAVVSSVALQASFGLAGGFDRWLGPPPGVTRREDFAVAREARHWMLSRDGSRPWFLWVHLNGAHGPYRVAQNPFGSLAPFASRARAAASVDRLALPVLANNTGRGGVPAYQAVRGVTSAAQYRALHDTLTLVGDFFAGELLDTLGVTGADASTVVAIIGTHGESLGEQDVFFNHGENLDESVLRVPLIVRMPGAAPATIDAPVSALDVLPTLLSLAGQPPAADVSGADLSGGWVGGAALAQDRAGSVSELFPPQGAASLLAVSGRRYRVELSGDGSLRAVDLVAPGSSGVDPVAPGDTEMRSLRAALEAWRARTTAAPGRARTLTPEQRAALVSLGYVAERLPPD